MDVPFLVAGIISYSILKIITFLIGQQKLLKMNAIKIIYICYNGQDKI